MGLTTLSLIWVRCNQALHLDGYGELTVALARAAPGYALDKHSLQRYQANLK